MYDIQPFTFQQAKQLKVIVQPSSKKGKKIDVYHVNGEYITSVGALGMGDYPTYLKLKGENFAANRRRLFKLRNEKSRHNVGSNTWFADQLLW